EAREERQRVGGRAREPRQHLFTVQPPNLPRFVLDDPLAHGHLTVAGDRQVSVATHGQDRSAPDRQRLVHQSSILPLLNVNLRSDFTAVAALYERRSAVADRRYRVRSMFAGSATLGASAVADRRYRPEPKMGRAGPHH